MRTSEASRPCDSTQGFQGSPLLRDANLGREFGRGGSESGGNEGDEGCPRNATKLSARRNVCIRFAYREPVTFFSFFLSFFFFLLFQRRNTSHDCIFSPFLSLSLLLRPMQMERAGMEGNWTNREKNSPRTFERER